MNADAMIKAASVILNQQRLNNELMQAISLKKAGMLKSLIDQGADVNFNCPDSVRTPLTMAINHQFYKGVQILLIKGADVNLMHRKHQEFTPLNAAVLYGDPKLVQLILEQRINHGMTRKFKKNTLMYCIDGASEDNLKYLLDIQLYKLLKDDDCKRTLAYAKIVKNVDATIAITTHLKHTRSQLEKEQLMKISNGELHSSADDITKNATNRIRL